MPDDIITVGADKAIALEKQFASRLQELKAVQAQIDETWQRVKDAMVENDIKSLKGQFGSITIAERTTYKVNEDELEKEFFTLKPDLKKIGNTYALMNEPPKGVTPQTTQYLMKRLK